MLSRATTTTARWLISSQRPAAAAASRSASVININCQQQRCLNVASKPSDLVGNTPLIDLNKILVAHGVDVDNGVKLYGKLESLGPCSSVKDRLGRSMIDDAEAKGLITPGRIAIAIKSLP